ncbi:MAG: hypothetical protein HY769_04495 [Candidatus Stahlbacteria bacterium]|nr:hypothetical protein [Candidatus Stahlbacteria bacterium]
MLFFCIFISIETMSLGTPLRMKRLLLTTPMNVYTFTTQFERYEDFFLALPSLQIKNDTLYYMGSSKVLVLLDGVPVSSISEVCLPAIEKIEVVAQDASSLYGKYDAVINIITKSHEDTTSYSCVKLYKNPDHLQFELGRQLFKGIDFYLTGDMDSTSQWSTKLGYTNRFAQFQAYYSNNFILRGSLFSNFNFCVKKDYFLLTDLWTLRGHKILVGTENISAFFVQDYWEPYPLLYVVPGVRYDTTFYPKLSLGYIPRLDMTIFGSATSSQVLLGIRVFDSSISAFRSDGKYGVEARFISPWIRDFKFTLAGYIPSLLDCQSISIADYFTASIEYGRGFKGNELGVSVFGDLHNLRLEVKVIDIKIFYRIQQSLPSFGLLWEFWD